MPKLVLKYEDRVLQEIPVGEYAVTIGRLPNNTVVLDNPAVSSHHARVAIETNQCVVEDLRSMNGTLVNNQLVTRHTLAEGDVIQIGKHKLVFSEAAVEQAAASAASSAAPVQDMGGTVFLDTKEQKKILAKLALQAQQQAPVTPTVPYGEPEPVPQRPLRALSALKRAGVLTVLAGSTDKRKYTIESQTILVGKSASALVRLKGWFKPKLAAAITRKGEVFVVTPLGGKAFVNNQPLTTRHELEDGDVLKISGVTLQFTYKD